MTKSILFLILCINIISYSASAKEINIWIDTDPALGISKHGKPRDIDDSFMLIEALNDPQIKVRGISTVFGNATAKQGRKLVSELLDIKKRPDIPLVSGHEREWLSGQCKNKHAVKKIWSEMRAYKDLYLVAVGPLTNIACLLKEYPEASKHIKSILVVMGRSIDKQFYINKKGPLRDFNFAKDPLAAQFTLSSAVPLILLPFELTVQAYITPDNLRSLSQKQTPVAKYVTPKAKLWMNFWKSTFPQEPGFHPWDSAAIAYLLNDEGINCQQRGYRVRNVANKAHGLGKNRTGLMTTVRPWLELDTSLPGKQLTFCYSFSSSAKASKFSSRIMSMIY